MSSQPNPADRGLVHALRAYLQPRLDRRIDRAWDLRHRVDTCGRTLLRDLKIEAGDAQLGFEYAPSPVSMIRSSLARLPRTEGLTFVDFGSGKGRVLLVAAEYPFRKIIGVEFAAELHEAAVRNIASYRNPRQKCFDIEAVLGDASQFPISDDPCLLYFYTPFKGPLMQQVLDNVAASYQRNPRPMYVVYGYQIEYHLRMFDALPGFVPIRAREPALSLLRKREDVHVFGTREAIPV